VLPPLSEVYPEVSKGSEFLEIDSKGLSSRALRFPNYPPSFIATTDPSEAISLRFLIAPSPDPSLRSGLRLRTRFGMTLRVRFFGWLCQPRNDNRLRARQSGI